MYRVKGRSTQGHSPHHIYEDDNCMHDIQYNEDTVTREEDTDDVMASDEDDEMEDMQGSDEIAACRGQKRRLHTMCEISFVARSKMMKQLEHGVT